MEKLTIPDLTCFALYSANHAMQRVYQPVLAPMGLTYPQFLVLMALWDQDDRTVGDLARALYLETNTLTPLLKRMEAQGLLERTRDKRDERQVRVTLALAGQALQAKAEEVHSCIFQACGMDLAELTALRDQVLALRDRLSAA